MSKKSCVKVCKKCGKEFTASSGHVKYCDDCAKEMKQETLIKFRGRNFWKKQEELLKGVENVDYVIDRWNGLATRTICSKWMATHHPDKTLGDYKREFPDAPIVCKKTSDTISNNTKSFMNTPEMKEYFSERFKGDKNPNAKCNTTEEQRKSISPFSKSFKGYEGMSDEEKQQNIMNCLKLDKSDRTTCQIGYWTNKGYTEEEAREKVAERQRTFTLEKCIEKYGLEDGYKKWKERQEKWTKSLIHSFETDGDNRTPTSKFENDCKRTICELLKIDVPKKQKYITDKLGNHYAYDLTINHKIIEFNGDYWHMNPQLYDSNAYNKTKQMSAYEIWEHDKQKIQCAESHNYSVLVIWESDYNTDKDGTIQKCIDFLTK